MESQSAALNVVLREVPGSIRKLARAAGLSNVALIRARDGDFQLGPDKIAAIVKALRLWSTRCAELADRLEAAERTPPKENNNAEN